MAQFCYIIVTLIYINTALFFFQYQYSGSCDIRYIQEQRFPGYQNIIGNVHLSVLSNLMNIPNHLISYLISRPDGSVAFTIPF